MLWVGFTKENNLLSRAIRWVTNGSYSHALLIWEDPLLGWLRMEAGWDGYHVRPSQPPKALQRIDRIRDADFIAVPLVDQYDRVLTHCAKHLGASYDYPGAVGYLWVALGRLFRKAWRNPLASPNALFCSEAIAEGLKTMLYPGFEAIDPSTVSPQLLFDLLTKNRQMVWVVHE